MKTTGRRLKEALKRKGYKQKELSNLTGIPETTISDIVKDKKEPGVYKMQLIAEALDLDFYWLVTGKSISDKKSEEPISSYKIADKKAPRIAEEKSKYQIKLPNGDIIEERRKEYKAEYISEIIPILQELTPADRHFLLRLTQQIKADRETEDKGQKHLK